MELLWDYLESKINDMICRYIASTANQCTGNDAIVAEDVTFVVPPPEDYPPYAGDAQVEVV